MNTKLVSSIDDVARSRLATIAVDALLLDAAQRLADTQASLLVVCGGNGAMVGVITKTDVVSLIGVCGGSACRTSAADVMTADVVFCRPSDYLPDVLAMMHERGFVHIPVLDGDFRPVGVVNARDALRALMADEEYEQALLRDYVMGVGYR